MYGDSVCSDCKSFSSKPDSGLGHLLMVRGESKCPVCLGLALVGLSGFFIGALVVGKFT